MRDYENKVAVITGAGAGVGAATARLLAARGASVVVADIDGERAAATVQQIVADGGAAVASTTDVADEQQVAAMIETACREFGGLDLLHNNAALLNADVIGRDGAITDADADLWDRVLHVNLVGYVLGAKHAIPVMIERGGGVIVNTTSGTGVQAELSRPAYGTSKAAIIGLTRNIATQYGRQGIRCVALALGLVGTPGLREALPEPALAMFMRHFPIARLIEPEEVAEAVAFVASERAAMITGATIPIDGGFSVHTPTFADELDMVAQMQA